MRIGWPVESMDEAVEAARDHWPPPPSHGNRTEALVFEGACRAGRRVTALLDAGQILGEGGQ